MGKSYSSKIILVIIVLILTSIFAYRNPNRSLAEKGKHLSHAIINLDKWLEIKDIRLDDSVIKALKLDDYLYRIYKRENDTVSLYIGYYRSEDKIGEAHDPLVCFPGQGWVITDQRIGSIDLDGQKHRTIRFSSFIAQMGDENEFVIYWFQSYDKSSPDTFTQKINSILHRFRDKAGDNAFIRISIPMKGKTVTDCLRVGHEFMNSFYPRFLDFVYS